MVFCEKLLLTCVRNPMLLRSSVLHDSRSRSMQLDFRYSQFSTFAILLTCLFASSILVLLISQEVTFHRRYIDIISYMSYIISYNILCVVRTPFGVNVELCQSLIHIDLHLLIVSPQFILCHHYTPLLI